jgi:general secretion pathway protein D
MMRKIATVFVIALAMTSCSADGTNDGLSPLMANRDNPSNTATAYERFTGALNGRSGDTRALGTDRFLGQGSGPGRPLIESDASGEFMLNLVNVPIQQAADAVLSDALERTYSIAPGVEGRITLQTTRPLNASQLIEVFQTVLELNGATLDENGGILTIVPLSGATGGIAQLGDPIGPGTRIVAVPLAYIGTAEMLRLLRPIVGTSVGLTAIPNRNILLVSGSRSEINSAIEAINLFDIDILEGRSIGVFQLNAAAPETVVEELEQIFETGPGGSLEDVLMFIPSDRIGAVIVISSRSRYLTEAEQWINDLDRAAGGVRRRPVVYSLQNRNATDLAPILSEMLEAGEAEGPMASAARIVADNTNNAIVVWGNDTEQEAFARLIQSLDTTPVQVLLETTIAEVTLNDELNFGLRWFFENGGFRGGFSDAANGGVGSTFPGLSFAFQGASAGVTLNALASITDVNVISSPSLLVLDNQEARLQIGDQVPVATQQVTGTTAVDAPIVNTISFRDTGIILTVRPRVSENGQVLLDIDQEVSSVSSTTTSGIDSPTISQRRIETTVVITDGTTIALGGLIEESRNLNRAQVPGIGDVPLLGVLFRNRSDRIARTELLILITPRVIRNGVEASSITAELRQGLQSVNTLIETGVQTPAAGHRILN